MFWTGDINRKAQFEASVGLYDTTLRDGEQTVGVVFTPEDKLDIARLVDGLGVGRIEVGFPRVSDDDREACRIIAAAGLSAEVWGFSRAVEADIEEIVRLEMPATIIEAPISDQKLAALGVEPDSMLRRIVSAIRFATEHGVKVAFFGVDSTRAEREAYRRVYSEAVEAGAAEVCVVDTLGIASPEAVADLVADTIETLGPDVPVHFHGHNDFGLATAGCIAAVKAGASWIHGTINGMGERAGNVNLPEVALALRGIYGIETGLRLERVQEVSGRVMELAGYELEPFKPLVGANLFLRESGAVASQFHRPWAIEPYSSELVGAKRDVVLGKKSGIDSIRIACRRLRLDMPEEVEARRLLGEVKELGSKSRRLVTDDEFLDLMRAGRDQ